MIQQFITNTNNFTRGRGKGNTIRYIVIHTYGGVGTNLFNWFQNNPSRVSAHYSVEKSGVIRQYVRDSDSAHHAGNSTMNFQSIGIEHQDDGRWNDPLTYTQKQYEESAKLVRELCLKYNIPITREFIIPHNQIITGRACPGKLDINKIIEMANQENVNYSDPDLWKVLNKDRPDVTEIYTPDDILMWWYKTDRVNVSGEQFFFTLLGEIGRSKDVVGHIHEKGGSVRDWYVEYGHKEYENIWHAKKGEFKAKDLTAMDLIYLLQEKINDKA